MNEVLRTIDTAEARPDYRMLLTWADGTSAEIDLSDLLSRRDFAALRDERVFQEASVGEHGHSLVWPGGLELGADSLWRSTLLTLGRDDTVAFLDWRMKHGLSLAAAARELSLSRRMVAYYSSGARPVPRTVLLACKGWEAEHRGVAA